MRRKKHSSEIEDSVGRQPRDVRRSIEEAESTRCRTPAGCSCRLNHVSRTLPCWPFAVPPVSHSGPESARTGHIVGAIEIVDVLPAADAVAAVGSRRRDRSHYGYCDSRCRKDYNSSRRSMGVWTRLRWQKQLIARFVGRRSQVLSLVRGCLHRTGEGLSLLGSRSDGSAAVGRPCARVAGTRGRRTGPRASRSAGTTTTCARVQGPVVYRGIGQPPLLETAHTLLSRCISRIAFPQVLAGLVGPRMLCCRRRSVEACSAISRSNAVARPPESSGVFH